MRRPRLFLAAAVSGGIALGSVLFLSRFPVRLVPGTSAWHALVAGASREGRIASRAVIRLPGLARRSPTSIEMQLAPGNGQPSVLGVSVDGEPVYWIRTGADGTAFVRAPASPTPGLRLELHRRPEAPPIEVRAVALSSTGSVRYLAGLLAFLAAALTSFWASGRLGTRAAWPAGLLVAAFSAWSVTPSTLFLLFLETGALFRLILLFGLLAAGTTLALRLPRSERRAFAGGAALLLCAVLGMGVRLYFLPSAGSWDTEYWKAWMLRAAVHGVGRVYGDAGTVPPGHFLAQLRGEEPTWSVRRGGREMGIDYPPLAMILWRGAWALIERVEMDPAERENVASKLPAVLGDVAAVLVLWWGLSDRPRRARVLAALYWVLPVSWLGSAVLGYQDATYAPLTAGAILAAGRGRPFWAGALLSLACLVKPLALLIAPAAAIALLAVRRRPVKAVASGLGGAVVFALPVLLPFWIAGTLPEMTVHVLRAFSPGNLSSGCANVWWLVSELLTAGRDIVAVPFVRLAAVDFPCAPVATAALLILVGWMAWRQHVFSGARPAALAAATMLYAYAMVAVGVYENHPHLVLLLLFLSGLATRRLRMLTVIAGSVYVLNLLALSGIGRFYGNRYLAIEPLAGAISSFRLALGFDVITLLAVVNVAVFVLLLRNLRAELESTE